LLIQYKNKICKKPIKEEIKSKILILFMRFSDIKAKEHHIKNIKLLLQKKKIIVIKIKKIIERFRINRKKS
jgi:hypothetical protein